MYPDRVLGPLELEAFSRAAQKEYDRLAASGELGSLNQLNKARKVQKQLVERKDVATEPPQQFQGLWNNTNPLLPISMRALLDGGVGQPKPSSLSDSKDPASHIDQSAAAPERATIEAEQALGVCCGCWAPKKTCADYTAEDH